MSNHVFPSIIHKINPLVIEYFVVTNDPSMSTYVAVMRVRTNR